MEVIPYLRTPALNPDGSLIAFSYAGDIWVVESSGGEAYPVTSHGGYEERPRFSPDGGFLAFVSKRTGNGDIYLMPWGASPLNPSPEYPRRLTYSDSYDSLDCWSPDGRWIYFNSGHDGRSIAAYKVSIDGGEPVKLFEEPFEAAYNIAVSPDGRRIAFNNNGAHWWRRGPAPITSDIWLTDEAASSFKKISDHPGRNLYPMWSPDGSGIYFVSDRSGCENIWFMPLDGSVPYQVTDFKEGRLIRPSISYDGRFIAFERDFGIWLLELESRQSVPVEIKLRPDQKFVPISHKVYTGDISEMALSPDGKKIVFVVRGEIFAVPSDKGGDAFRVTESHHMEHQIDWSPDSRRIVYVSDRFGDNEIFLYDFTRKSERRLTRMEGQKFLPKFSPDGKKVAFIYGRNEIRLLDVESGEVQPFIKAKFVWGVPTPTDFAWSPDGEWIAFAAQDERYFSNVYLQRLGETEARQITFLSNIRCNGITWAPNGKFILFNTGQYRSESQIARVDLIPPPPEFKEEEFDRLFTEEKKEEKEKEKEGEPPKVEVEFEEIKYRLSFLTSPRLNATICAISPDAKSLIYRSAVTGQENLWVKSLERDKKGEPAKQITSSSGAKRDVRFVPDGKRIYFLDGGKIHHRGFPDGDVKRLDVKAEFDVDFHREKMEVFNQAWTLIRDDFFDPSYNGADWHAVRQRFEPAVRGTMTHEDLVEVLSLMMGELNVSHTGVLSRSGGNNNAFLGVHFDRKALEDEGHLKIAEIIPQGPIAIAENPPKVGDYIVEVDGVRIERGVCLGELLFRKAGKRVFIKVNNRPVLDGARQIAVQPVDFGRIRNLEYRNWVRRNAEYVHRKSDGRLGYVHIRAMDYPSYMQFLVDLDVETHAKEGVIVDVRYNGGGHTASFILDVLLRRGYALSRFRDTAIYWSTNIAGNRILDKPVILVHNEHSGSNAEMFTEGFRRLNLGKTVGTPTAGSVIWTWNVTLIDGTRVRIPRFQIWSPSGENLEGRSREADFWVEREFGETMRGVDSQLDVAIEKLLEGIEGMKREG